MRSVSVAAVQDAIAGACGDLPEPNAKRLHVHAPSDLSEALFELLSTTEMLALRPTLYLEDDDSDQVAVTILCTTSTRRAERTVWLDHVLALPDDQQRIYLTLRADGVSPADAADATAALART